MPTEKILSANLFPVVGIGASAGGLEAFKRLIKSIPEDSGMAYILVQHLDPGHESILAELLQKVTKIPVLEITDNVHVEADHIYIIPSNKLLTATDGVLQLSPRLANQRHMPIDLFFSSLAEVHQSHAIGVVLSGTATDGTLGLKAIKDHGGITFAQDRETAAYDGMPQSAVDADVVDFILPPEKIPQQLLALNGTLKNISPADPANEHLMQENWFKQILSLLRVKKGVDFTYYKQTTIRRRITRRIALSMKNNIAEYLVYLKENPAEQDILYQDLLIPVTQFFRDPAVFGVLCEKVFPLLVKKRDTKEPLRLWIAGCSTGEEAYSMVMCMQEYLAENSISINIQVFATDISDIAIAKARNGMYKKSDVEGLSATRLQQFFTRADGNYRVNKSVRDICVFAYHNYLKDPPFANIDLISCRNSLIYLEPFLQKKALTTFHYALKDKGFLVLGKSETTGQAAELFSIFDNPNKIYIRKAAKGKFLQVMMDGRREDPDRVTDKAFGRNESVKDDFQKNADEVLLSKYAPPGVIVNNDLDIVQFRGATGIWLEQSPGKPNLNVVKMARVGLAFELRNALHKIQKSKESLIKEDIPFQFMGKDRLVTIEVIPLLNTIEPHYLILFRDVTLFENNGEEAKENNQSPKTTAKESREKARILKLEKELAQARDDMRSITEDQEASNEELQSANEELLSGSEELQSLNEELETSREETQTSNEELIIVNQELYDRNEQLNLARLYSESIVTTIREPLIILNKNLQVRSANRAFYNKFLTTPEATEGKLLFDFANKQWDIPGLRKMLEKILPGKTSIIDFEVAHNFHGLGDRIMLLNASRIVRDNSDDQYILLAIEDITEKRKVENELKLFAEQLEKQVMERTLSLHEANIDLQHSNKNLEQFAYIASHDLQEPLRKIKTFASLLLDRYIKELPEAAKELIEKINASASRMSTLIKDVLNFSKILHSADAYETTDLNEILIKVIEDFDLLITEKKAVIKMEPLPVVEAIPLQINQLFYNLISNSLKFSRKGIAPEIRISSKQLTPKELLKHKGLNNQLPYYEICVKDNGIGFYPQFAEQIFLIFQRLHSRDQYSGTGIGLALCKSIVINHHGEINAISNNNKGALFQIILPLKQAVTKKEPDIKV